MLNLVDLGVLLILGLSILIGIWRGATREVLGIVGWIGALAVAYFGFPLLRPLGQAYIKSPMLADIVIAVLLFIISLCVFILISRTISSTVKGSLLGGLDRSLGLIFGFVRGTVVLCLAFLAFGFFYPSEETPEVVKTARFTPLLSQGSQLIMACIPQDYLPKKLAVKSINPLDAQDLIENSLPSLDDMVINLSTLKPVSPRKYNETEIEQLIEEVDATPQE